MTTSKFALVATLTAATLLGACDSTLTEPSGDKTAPTTLCETGPYLIHLSGQCRVASSHRIVCEDETTTTPQDKVLNIVFQLRNATTGAPIETKSLNPGVLPREVSFSGLNDNSYEVRHTVQTSVSSLLQLLEDLLSLARLEAGRDTLNVQTFDAGALLQSLCATLEPRAHQKGLSLRGEGPESLMVEGDRTKIQRIVQNLALNAIKYTDNGEITLGWGATEETDIDRWRLRIQDTGPGMSSSVRGPLAEGLREATGVAKITEDLSDSPDLEPVPAFAAPREPQPSTFQRPGEGIGLLIVKRLCELLLAALEIVSEPGRGTIVQVVLPRSYTRPG